MSNRRRPSGVGVSPTVAVRDAAAGVSRRRATPARAVPAGGTITVGAGGTVTVDHPATPAAPPPARERVTLSETGTRPLGEAAGDGAHQLVQLISAGWGSSGYYGTGVLAEAARQRRFPAGLHMYMDHPSASDLHERPERSVRDIAAVLAEDARYDPGRKALVAKVRVLPTYRPLLSDLAEHVGLSIRADGMAEMGEAEGRHGPIVKEITEALSVDYVTKAGRGGKVLALLESARAMACVEARTLGAWLESKLHLALTTYADEMYGNGQLTREERITLSAAIGDGLQAWTARVEGEAPQLFQRDLWDEPGPQPVAATESAPPSPDEPVEPTAPGLPEPTTAPAASGDNVTAGATPPAPNPTEGEPDMSGTETGPAPGTAGAATVADTAGLSQEARAQIAEAQLREAQARITVLEGANASLTVERDTAKGEVRRIRNVETARTTCSTVLAGADLPHATLSRITESVTASVPTTEAGDVDTTALQAAITRHVESERTYIASIREAAGQGTPSGLGGSVPVQDVPAWQADLANRFGRLGLNESASKLAAGR